jgi:hypothetical protein
MLLQPFLGALIVLKKLAWPVAPALAAVILVFLVRDPLIVLARQRWVWRDQHVETAAAKRYLAVELLLLGAAGALLLLVWPLTILIALGAGAAVLTALAVYITIRNRQRALWFQALSAAGLSSSALAACVAVAGAIPNWAWWWWGLHSAHFLASILVVHVRLEARIAARKPAGVLTPAFIALRREAAMVEAVVLIAAAGFFATGRLFYAAAALLSAVFHLYDLFTMHRARALAVPMTRVGKRALAVSIAFALLAIAGSWRQLPAG